MKFNIQPLTPQQLAAIKGGMGHEYDLDQDVDMYFKVGE